MDVFLGAYHRGPELTFDQAMRDPDNQWTLVLTEAGTTLSQQDLGVTDAAVLTGDEPYEWQFMFETSRVKTFGPLKCRWTLRRPTSEYSTVYDNRRKIELLRAINARLETLYRFKPN